MEAKRAKTGAISKAKPVSKTKRAKLIFPVSRIHRLLRNGNFAPRIGSGASVYLTAVLEYLCAEIMELASKAASDNKKNRISPRFILLAIRNDDELNNLLSGAVISSGGTIPKIHAALLPKKTMKKSAKDTTEADVSSQEY